MSFNNIEDWAHLRARAIDAFDGELPNPITEQTVIDAYQQHPEAVTKAISQVAADFKKGTIRTGWGVTKNRAERILHPPSNPTAKSGADREKAIARAEQWIRNAGAHFDRESEVQDELFNERGLLSDHRTDLLLIDRILEAWRQARPEGERIEHEADERGRRWIAHQAKLQQMAAAKAAELEQAAHDRERITDERTPVAAPAKAAGTAPAPDPAHEEVPF